MAEGAFREMATACGMEDYVFADSAGTINFHSGEGPDPRAQQTALMRGFDIAGQRARSFVTQDFFRFDIILAMDRSHLSFLEKNFPNAGTAEIKNLLYFAPQTNVIDVPDPYYGDISDFKTTMDLIEAGCAGLIDEIRRGFHTADRGLRDLGRPPST
jgi:protein-tyrosine phosphatase